MGQQKAHPSRIWSITGSVGVPCAVAAPCSHEGEVKTASTADPEPNIRVSLYWAENHFWPIYYVRL